MIKTLFLSDVGKTVYYIPSHAKTDTSQWERGRIKSFNNEEKVAWVVYDNGNPSKVDHFTEYTAARTEFADLSLVKGMRPFEPINKESEANDV